MKASPVRPTYQPNMLRIIKMNAEKIRNKDINLILRSSDPKVKDAKPKVQSFQKNYYKPLFLPQKKKPSSIKPKIKPSHSASKVKSLVTRQVRP